MNRADGRPCLHAPLGTCKILMERQALMARNAETRSEKRMLSSGDSCAGRSLLEMIEERLDDVVDRLMAGEAEDTDKGAALGLAEAIAIIKNPYYPDVDVIRAEAMERYDERHGGAPGEEVEDPEG